MVLVCYDNFFLEGGGGGDVSVACTALPLETGGSNHDANLTL